jgi:flagellar hook assembly protein FlgD
VEVLDPLGRVVRILTAGQQTAGPHQATWDGRDADGRPVASGVCLCRLVASRLVLTRRLVLVR